MASLGSSTSLCEPQTDLTPQGDIDEKVTVVRTRLLEQLVTKANSPTMAPGLAVDGLTPILMFRQLDPPPPPAGRSGDCSGFEDCANNGRARSVTHANNNALLLK